MRLTAKTILLNVLVFFLFAGIATAAAKPDGGYASFDGSGDYVQVQNSNTLDFNSFSIGFWINAPNTGGNYRVILMKGRVGDSGYNDQGVYIRLNNDNKMEFYVADEPAHLISDLYSTQPIADNKWHYIVAVRNASNNISLYVDGTLNATSTDVTSSTLINNKNLYLGRIEPSHGAPGWGNTYYEGSLDEVQMFNRTLTALEINQTYQRGLQGRKSNITTNLTAYYDFENNGTADNTQWKDKNGANHGTANGDIYTTEHIGGVGFFDGSSDYVCAPASSNWSFGTGDFSLSLWANFDNIGGLTQSLIGTTGGNAGSRGWYFDVYSTGLVFDIATSPGSWSLHYTESTSFSPKIWYHLVVVRSGTSLKMYRNGVLLGSGATSSQDIVNENNLCIAGHPVYGGYWFNENIDDVLVFKGKALSTEEINQIYERGVRSLRSNITTNLVGYWPMDTNFSDYSGMENHGTAQNQAFSTNITYGISYSGELSGGYNLTDSDGNLIGSKTSASKLQIRKAGAKKVEFSVDESFDLSSVNVDSDSGRTVVSGLSQSTPGVTGTHTIFIPNVNGNGVYICPSATQLSDVSPSCPGVIKVACPGTNGSISCAIDGSDYKISGLTSSGGGNSPLGGISDAVPEFSDYALLLAIVVSVTGLLVVRRKSEI